jgi:hypothetical protein
MVNYQSLDKLLEILDNYTEESDKDVVKENTDDSAVEVLEEGISISTIIDIIIVVATIISVIVISTVGRNKRKDFYYNQIVNNKNLIDLLNRLTKNLNKDIASRMGKYGKYVQNFTVEGGSIYWNGNSANMEDGNNIIYFLAGGFDAKNLFKSMFSKEYTDVIYDTTPATTKKVQEFNSIIKQYNAAVSMENKLISSKTGMDGSIYLDNMEGIYGNIPDYTPYADPTEPDKEIIYVCYMRLMDYTKLTKLPEAIKSKIKARVNAMNDYDLKEAVELIIDGKL